MRQATRSPASRRSRSHAPGATVAERALQVRYTRRVDDERNRRVAAVEHPACDAHHRLGRHRIGTRRQPDRAIPHALRMRVAVAYLVHCVRPPLRQRLDNVDRIARRRLRIRACPHQQRGESAVAADDVDVIGSGRGLVAPYAVAEQSLAQREQRQVARSCIVRDLTDVGQARIAHVAKRCALARCKQRGQFGRRPRRVVPCAVADAGEALHERRALRHFEQQSASIDEEARTHGRLVIADLDPRDGRRARDDEDAEHRAARDQQRALIDTHPSRIELAPAPRAPPLHQPSRDCAHAVRGQTAGPELSGSPAIGKPSARISSASLVTPSLRIAASFCALIVFLLRWSFSAISVTL